RSKIIYCYVRSWVMLRSLRVINLASTLTHYTAGLRLQDSVVEERRQGLVDDTLILLQVVAGRLHCVGQQSLHGLTFGLPSGTYSTIQYIPLEREAVYQIFELLRR
ncbi:hypothetical protein Vretifemale_14220, partial [Volvox reticuliferus]